MCCKNFVLLFGLVRLFLSLSVRLIFNKISAIIIKKKIQYNNLKQLSSRLAAIDHVNDARKTIYRRERERLNNKKRNIYKKHYSLFLENNSNNNTKFLSIFVCEFFPFTILKKLRL